METRIGRYQYLACLLVSLGLLVEHLGPRSSDLPLSQWIAKSRYHTGLMCRDRGWEFCAGWADSRIGPNSRLAKQEADLSRRGATG